MPIATAITLIATSFAATASPASLAGRAPACTARDLTLTTDGADGDFNGMSHGSTYLVIRNRGRRACSVPGLPVVTMRDARGRALPIARQVPVGMHPGPVIVPVTIAAGARVATGVRWIAGPVFEHSHRFDVRSVDVAIGGGRLAAPLRATIFAEGSKPGTFEQPVLGPYPPGAR